MDLLPNKAPTPRLLTSLSPPAPDPRHVLDTTITSVAFSRPGFFSGARGWFAATLGSALLVAMAAHNFGWSAALQKHQREVRMLPVATHRLAAAPHSIETPAPVTIQYAPEMLHVSAIALGHPRLAVINGRALAEGDPLVLHAPTRNVAVTLLVTRIADGYVDLTDGTQTITAHLIVPPTKNL